MVRCRLLGALCVALAAVLVAAPAAMAGRWLAGDLHVHTTYSHDSYGGPTDDNTGPDEGYTLGHSVFSQFAVGASRGLHYLAITDHNDVRSQRDPGFGAFGLVAVPGYEASLRGHAQMLGARRVYPSGDASVAAVRALAAALRRDGGVFQVNHPAEGSTRFPEDRDWAYGYEVVPNTVEVWNISRLYQPPFPSGSSNDDAVRYWEGWLDRGYRIAATGGSDNHYLSTTAVQGAGQPTTWVFAADSTVKGVLAGLRAGRTFISHQPPGMGGPQLFLEADGNRDGRYEAMVGDAVRPGSPLRVRVIGGAGSFLRVITNRGRQAFAPVAVSSASFEHRFSLPKQSTWVRTEIFDPDLAEQRKVACDDILGTETTYCRNLLLVLGMTSALYLREPPKVPPGRARLHLPRGCARRPFTAWVDGRSIERVAFRVDRGRSWTVRRADRRGRFLARIDTRRLRPGRHGLRATAYFKRGSGTRPAGLSGRFSVCRPSGPRYTG